MRPGRHGSERGLGGVDPSHVRLFTLAVLAASVTHVGLYLYYAYATRVLRPYGDLFDLVDVYLRLEQTGDWLGYLLEPHSYHRLPWFRLLLAFDIRAFGGSGLPFVAAAAICLGWTAVVVARHALATPSGPLRLPGAAIVLMIVFSAANAVGVSVPANTPYLHTLLFVVLAIVLAEPEDGGRPAATRVRRLAAIACACAAVLSNAVGIVVWPVLAFSALRKGDADRPWLIALLVAGGGFSTAYVWGLVLESSAGSWTLDSLIKAVDYFFAYVGLPWSRASPTGGRAMGIALVGFSAIAILRRGGPDAARTERVAVALILFTLGTALLAALGRQGIADAVVVPGRYNVLTVPLKVGLVLLVLPWLAIRWAKRPRRVEAAVAAAVFAYLLQQVAVGAAVVPAARNHRATIEAFESGVRSQDMVPLIHPILPRAEAVAAKIRERGIYRRGAPTAGVAPTIKAPAPLP